VSSESLHESEAKLQPATVDRHRAISSLMEELEAVDWYDQRIDATDDRDLAAILRHNRDEEKEHAAMVLEWLRRHDDVLDRHLRTYLFTEGSVLEVEKESAGDSDGGGGGDTGGSGGLGIGALRDKEDL
jgi:ferritin-like protein